MLSEQQISVFRQNGHLTVPSVLNDQQLDVARTDIEAWGTEFTENLEDDQKQWFLEGGGAVPLLRKLDNPAYCRPVFRDLALSVPLVRMVEQLIGAGVSIFYSQVFCKPPEIGGPKPVHQDNFYFGPDNPDATLTVWIAIDEATVENGCLFYADGSHLGPIRDHIAPPAEPFNLQVAPAFLGQYEMTAAPVPAGGVSFHHGNTWHQSSANTSARPRRAVAFHYLQNDAALVQPALKYDPAVLVRAGDS